MLFDSDLSTLRALKTALQRRCAWRLTDFSRVKREQVVQERRTGVNTISSPGMMLERSKWQGVT